MGLRDAPTVQWASDYSLVDIERELAILTAMQATGFAPIALAEQRQRVAGQLFDSMDDADLQDIMASLGESVQEIGVPDTTEPEDAPETEPPDTVDFTPVLDQIKALSVQVAAIPIEPREAPEPFELESKPDIRIDEMSSRMAELLTAVNALQAKANVPGSTEPPEPPEKVDLSPVLAQLASVSAQLAALQNEPKENTAQIVANEIKPLQAQITALAAMPAQVAQPAPMFMLDPTSGNVTKQIQITRDAAGNITGASVAPQP